MNNLYNVQYNDRIVSPHYFDLLGEDQLIIKSIFGTLQGEGPFAGRSCVFVRFAGCNRGDKELMACSFCDTDFRIDTGTTKTFDVIRDEIGEVFSRLHHSAFHKKLIVITGGEPMIQRNIVPFIEYLNENGYLIQIESNGDIVADEYEQRIYNTSKATLVVSPKLSPVFKRYSFIHPDTFRCMEFVKCIVDARKDSPFHNLPEWLYTWQMKYKTSQNVYISPITVYKKPVPENTVASFWNQDYIDYEKTRANYNYAAELCQNYDYVLSIQKHLFLELP